MRRPLTMLCAVALAASVPVSGQEERAIDHFAGVGTRAMGMGGAFVGVADDFTAVFWNPAGLAQMAHREVNVALLRNAVTNDAHLGDTPATADLSNTRFGSLGFVYPYPVQRGSLVLAAGINRVKDFDWILATHGQVDSLRAEDFFIHEGELSITSVAAAIDVSPSVSVGLTLSLTSGGDEATNQFISIDTENHFPEHRFTDTEYFIDEYQAAFAAILGAMVRVPREEPRLRVGATVSSGTTHLIRYKHRYTAGDEFTIIEYDDGSVIRGPTAEASDSYEIGLPFEFGLGMSYRPVPSLLVAASAHLAEWSQSEYSGDDEFGVRRNASFETQYEDVLRYHLGVEWRIPAIAVDVRAGFYTDPLPFVGPRRAELSPDDQTNPIVEAVEDRHYWTLGADILLEGTTRAQVAWNRGHFERVEGTGTRGLREEVTSNRVLVGVTYAF